MRQVWAFWQAYARRIGERQTQLWLWIVYFALIGPTWLVARVVGKRFFSRKGDPRGYWVARPASSRTVADMRRMG